MKITDYKNEDALELLVDIIEPTAKIFSDKELAEAVAKKANRLACVKIAVKNHKEEIIEILARIDGTPIEEFSCNVVTIIVKLLELLNDKEISDFFTSQAQMMAQTSSISAMANTKE